MRHYPISNPTHDYSPMGQWVNIGGFANAWQCGDLRAIVDRDHEGWQHVSVSLVYRCPTWPEMEFVKRSWFNPTETVMQLHVPEFEYVNYHPYCLHLWAPVMGFIPRPPNHLVGGR